MRELSHIESLRNKGFTVWLRTNGRIGIKPSLPPALKQKVEQARDFILAELKEENQLPLITALRKKRAECTECKEPVDFVLYDGEEHWGWYECPRCHNCEALNYQTVLAAKMLEKRGYCLLNSFLGQFVLLSESTTVLPENIARLVKFTLSEAAELIGSSKEMLQQIFNVKSQVGGQVVEAGGQVWD